MSDIRVKANFYLWLLTERASDFMDPSLNTHVRYAGGVASELVKEVRTILRLDDTRSDFYVLSAMAAAYTVPAALRSLPDESQIIFRCPPSLPQATSTARLTPFREGGLPYLDGSAASKYDFTSVKFTRVGARAETTNDGNLETRQLNYQTSTAGKRRADRLPNGYQRAYQASADLTDSGRISLLSGDPANLFLGGLTLFGGEQMLWDLREVIGVAGATEITLTFVRSAGANTVNVTTQNTDGSVGSDVLTTTATEATIPLAPDWDGILRMSPAAGTVYVESINIEVTDTKDQLYLLIDGSEDYGVRAGFLVDSWDEGDSVTVNLPPSNYDHTGMVERLRKSSAAVQLMAESGVLDAFSESSDPVRKVGAAAVAVIRQRLSEIRRDQEGFQVSVEREAVSLEKQSTLVPVWLDLFDETEVTTETEFNA